MTKRSRPARLSAIVLVLFAIAAVGPSSAAVGRDKKERPRPKAMRMYHFSADMLEGSLGATPGGAQDIQFLRDRVAAGEIPHPNVFTPEGLFSEHDLPVPSTDKCQKLLCIAGEGVEAGLIVQPEVRYLAQVGFTTGLAPKTFRRDPINLIAVIDQSGSMSGMPLETVKASLRHLIDQLRPEDQLAVVLYGSEAHVHFAPTPLGPAGERKALYAQVDRIQSEGSTYMEAGMKLGFRLARESAPRFEGITRVMLFTDERPNVGATDEESFMGLARAASEDGIGMTTVGVGVQFGAELATAVSSVRGGNLFFFPKIDKMKQVFRDEFDTLVTELAYDMEIELRPAAGLKIAGVYGIPGRMLKWTEGGALRVQIATIFLSKRRGAIFLSLAGDGTETLPARDVALGDALASVKLAYQTRDGERHAAGFDLAHRGQGDAGSGLTRGALLVDQVTALKEATRLHHSDNDQEQAYQIVHALAARLRHAPDAALDGERKLVDGIERTLARLSGHAGEPTAGAPVRPHTVTGLPPRR